MGNDGADLQPVEGLAEIDLDEVQDQGSFVATQRVPEGELVLEIELLHEFSPCQDGGVATYIYSHPV